VEPLEAELRAFVEVAACHGLPAVTGQQGRRAMATAQRIEEAMERNRRRVNQRFSSSSGS
jgi:hypothetical protein